MTEKFKKNNGKKRLNNILQKAKNRSNYPIGAYR